MRATTAVGLALASGMLVGCVAGAERRLSNAEAAKGPPPPATRPRDVSALWYPKVPTTDAPSQRPGDRRGPDRWVAGYWHWDGVRYVWIEGRWEKAEPAYVWR